MIGVSSASRSFTSLGRYLVVGRDEVQEGRVAWISARNLPTDDPELAATIMRATASQNTRVTQPVYHVSLSFDPRDAVDRSTMERVANCVLDELKLREYQAIIVAHADRRHPHMHILVNRIHPETGRAWDRWHDHTAIQRALQEQEKALGLRVVEGRSLPEIEARRTKTQSIEKDFDAHDQANEIARQRYSAEREVAAGQARLDQLDSALERLRRMGAAFDRALARAYRDPAAVKEGFLALSAEIGASAAAERMRHAPEMFGELAGSPRSSEQHGAAQSAAREAAAHGTQLVSAQRDVERIIEPSRTRSDVRSKPDELVSARTAVVVSIDSARDRLRGLQEAQTRHPSSEQIEYRLKQGLRRLSPVEFEQLRRTLAPHRLTLAYKLRQVVRDAALGRDMEE